MRLLFTWSWGMIYWALFAVIGKEPAIFTKTTSKVWAPLAILSTAGPHLLLSSKSKTID